MIIEHRGLIFDRFDTPFGVGVLIWAKGCSNHCPGCFHQDRFDTPVYRETIGDIIEHIRSYTFCDGIVLGGFEWTEQYDEMIALIEAAIAFRLEVILYTHYTIEEISTKYSKLLNYKGIYIKCGEYDVTKLSSNHSSYGVPLVSTNQKIYKVGVDV